jgi:NADH-quinone oxidoreductase subunit M
MQKWLWLAFFASFAVKMPMWPVHTWLPDAHVEAPTAGSVILAGILLKMGATASCASVADVAGGLGVTSRRCVFASGHRGRLHLAGGAGAGGHEEADRLFLGRAYGLRHHGHLQRPTSRASKGAIFQMISHGFVSGALFLCVGVIYDRMHTREIDAYGGVTNVMPGFAAVFMLFTMASAGLPATSGFVGEILVLVGTFQVSQWAAFGAATGLILGAAYMLWLYRRVMFGEVANHEVENLRDLHAREWLIFVPIILGVLWLGIYPKPTFTLVGAPVAHLLEQVGSVPLAAAEAPAATAEEGEADDEKAADNDKLENEVDKAADKKIADEPKPKQKQNIRVRTSVHEASETLIDPNLMPVEPKE